MFYFGEGPRAEVKVAAKANPRAQRSKTTLGTKQRNLYDFRSPMRMKMVSGSGSFSYQTNLSKQPVTPIGD